MNKVWLDSDDTFDRRDCGFTLRRKQLSLLGFTELNVLVVETERALDVGKRCLRPNTDSFGPLASVKWCLTRRKIIMLSESSWDSRSRKKHGLHADVYFRAARGSSGSSGSRKGKLASTCMSHCEYAVRRG